MSSLFLKWNYHFQSPFDGDGVISVVLEFLNEMELGGGVFLIHAFKGVQMLCISFLKAISCHACLIPYHTIKWCDGYSIDYSL